MTPLRHRYYCFFYCTTRTHSANYAVARCLSVRLSVTHQYCIEMAQHIANFTSG